MANDIFSLKIITPTGLVAEEKISAAKLPASDGEIGVLSQHERYVGNLGIGVMEYESVEEKKTKRLVVSGGFCSVEGETLIVLTDKVILPNSVDKNSFVADRERLKAVVNTGSHQSAEWVLAQDRLKEMDAVEALLAH